MVEINKPMGVPELNLQPPITGKVKLSPDMTQTLALLCAMGNSQRIVLKASESGVLLVGEPVIKDVVIISSAAGTGIGQGSDIPCSSVMVMPFADNTGSVYIRPYIAPDETHYWPLEKGDTIRFAVDNVNRVFFTCSVPEEKVIIAYTR